MYVRIYCHQLVIFRRSLGIILSTFTFQNRALLFPNGFYLTTQLAQWQDNGPTARNGIDQKHVSPVDHLSRVTLHEPIRHE